MSVRNHTNDCTSVGFILKLTQLAACLCAHKSVKYQNLSECDVFFVCFNFTFFPSLQDPVITTVVHLIYNWIQKHGLKDALLCVFTARGRSVSHTEWKPVLSSRWKLKSTNPAHSLLLPHPAILLLLADFTRTITWQKNVKTRGLLEGLLSWKLIELGQISICGRLFL